MYVENAAVKSEFCIYCGYESFSPVDPFHQSMCGKVIALKNGYAVFYFTKNNESALLPVHLPSQRKLLLIVDDPASELLYKTTAICAPV